MLQIHHFVSTDQQDTILGALRKGLPLGTSCQIARVPKKRLTRLLKDIDEMVEDPNFNLKDADIPTQQMVEFYFKVHEAGGRAQEQWVGYITENAEQDWKAAHALLKARNPEDWGEKQSVQLTADVNNRSQVAINLNTLSIVELEMLEKLMLKLSDGNHDNIIDASPDRVVLKLAPGA